MDEDHAKMVKDGMDQLYQGVKELAHAWGRIADALCESGMSKREVWAGELAAALLRETMVKLKRDKVALQVPWADLARTAWALADELDKLDPHKPASAEGLALFSLMIRRAAGVDTGPGEGATP